jgi:hypothetical protein
MNYKTIFFILLFLCAVQAARAEEFNLKNGDRITGTVVEEAEDFIVIDTKFMGQVKLNKEFIRELGEKKEAGILNGDVPDVVWDRRVSIGYNRSTGNTNSSELNSSFFVNKRRARVDEATLEGSLYYSSSDRKMDAQKWNGSGRYAFSFGSRKKWYNFYKLAVDHDRFADVDYRLLPSSGVGHWFYDTDPLKVMSEAGIGYEYTDYRDSDNDSKETVLAARFFSDSDLKQQG